MEENRPRGNSAIAQRISGALVQAPHKLLQSSLAAKLAWAGLILGVIAPLIFVLAGGPEWVVSVSNISVMWLVTWLFVGLVPVGSRVFTPWIGGAIDKVNPHKIVKVQKKRVYTLAPAMYLATILILWDKDLLSQMYINFIILGVATNVAALQEMWRNGLRKPVSKFTTSIVALTVPVAVGGLILNFCMAYIGSGYKHSVVGWVFALMPEIVVRPLLPLCYEVCFLSAMGIILTRHMPWGWERARWIAGGVVNNIAALLFFIWAGGEIGNILADNYAATGHTGLSQGLVHIIAISVIVRAPAYLIGGLGATWNAAGMNERIKQLLVGWLKSLFQSILAWLKSSLGVTELAGQVKEFQGQIATLEEEKKQATDSLQRVMEIPGLSELAEQLIRIRKQFDADLKTITDEVADSCWLNQRLDRYGDLLSSPEVSTERLMGTGKDLHEMVEQIASLQSECERKVEEVLATVKLEMEQFGGSQFPGPVSAALAKMEEEAIHAQRQVSTSVTLLLRKRSRLAKEYIRLASARSAKQRAEAEEHQRQAEAKTKQAGALTSIIQELTQEESS